MVLIFCRIAPLRFERLLRGFQSKETAFKEGNLSKDGTSVIWFKLRFSVCNLLNLNASVIAARRKEKKK